MPNTIYITQQTIDIFNTIQATPGITGRELVETMQYGHRLVRDTRYPNAATHRYLSLLQAIGAIRKERLKTGYKPYVYLPGLQAARWAALFDELPGSVPGGTT